jgi:hypothetical protein
VRSSDALLASHVAIALILQRNRSRANLNGVGRRFCRGQTNASQRYVRVRENASEVIGVVLGALTESGLLIRSAIATLGSAALIVVVMRRRNVSSILFVERPGNEFVVVDVSWFGKAGVAGRTLVDHTHPFATFVPQRRQMQVLACFFGAGEWTRTIDLLITNQP